MFDTAHMSRLRGVLSKRQLVVSCCTTQKRELSRLTVVCFAVVNEKFAIADIILPADDLFEFVWDKKDSNRLLMIHAFCCKALRDELVK